MMDLRRRAFRTKCLSALVPQCLLLLASLASAGELVRLKVADAAGVERRAEPVTSGIPFPQGAVKDAGELALTGPDGKPAPAAFTVLSTWPKDKSVRWALLDTQVSVPAKGTAELAVIQGAPAAPAAKLTVDDGAELITVSTGVLKFTVRKKGFRLFESAWLDESGAGKFDDAHRLLAEPAEGLAMTVKGTRYTSSGDAGSSVTVEEKNPMRVALLASGQLAGGGGDRYHYEVRIHAYAGSPVVKVVPTIIKKFGKRRDITQSFEDLSLGLKLAAAKDLSYALGGDDAPAAGKLEAGKTAGVLAGSSTKWEFTGEAKGSGDPRAKKPLSLGWADLSGSAGGVAVGVYRFWQVCPKGLELSGDGTIDVGLFPKKLGKPQEFYTGMARTHEVLMAFHGKAEPAELQKRFVAFQAPLFAQAPAEWYCQKTGVFGPMTAAGTELVAGAAAEVKKLDAQIAGCFDQLTGQRQDNYQRGGVTMDAYGFLAYGDTIHYTWDEEPVGNPWKIAWDSNYYDLPHLACLTFARTGERKYLDFFVDHSWHLMDVDVIFWDDSPAEARGGSRRCPATNHVGFDPPDHKEPVHNASFDHHKSESLFERYLLLGDRRALFAANELLWWAENTKRDGALGARNSANQTLTLVAGYWMTGEERYLARAKKLVDGNVGLLEQKKGSFQGKYNFTDGLVLESLARYHWATGDEAAAKGVQRYCDWQIDTKADGYDASATAIGHAFAYSLTGDEKYLKATFTYMAKGSTGNLGKDMAISFRSTPYISGLLVAKGK
jgi:hypothetical protein